MRREANWAGRFYAADGAGLACELDALLAGWEPAAAGPWALVVPHAGYLYSGATAAAAYACIEPDSVTRVILIGPAHHRHLSGFALSLAESWRSPLGEMRVDVAGVEALLAGGSPFVLDEAALAVEHSLEVQVPFLQRRVPNAELLPILMGEADAAAREDCLARLRALARAGDLWVITSDLSHYHARASAEILDARAELLIAAGRMAEFDENIDEGRIEACGAGPLAMLLAERERRGGEVRILDRRDSSVASGDEEQVVGYLSAACLPGRAND